MRTFICFILIFSLLGCTVKEENGLPINSSIKDPFQSQKEITLTNLTDEQKNAINHLLIDEGYFDDYAIEREEIKVSIRTFSICVTIIFKNKYVATIYFNTDQTYSARFSLDEVLIKYQKNQEDKSAKMLTTVFITENINYLKMYSLLNISDGQSFEIAFDKNNLVILDNKSKETLVFYNELQEKIVSTYVKQWNEVSTFDKLLQTLSAKLNEIIASDSTTI